MVDEKSGKRGMISDEQDSNTGIKNIKKSRIEDAYSDEVFVKILIPPAAAGAIIGKGGEAMRKLHEDTGCRVKMSKTTDIYPGTNERVAIVHGPVNAAMTVLRHFMGKIRQNENSLDYEERAKEVKVVVPNTSAAMVIGKSGSAIKEIRDKTGAGLQINPKQGSPEAHRSVERTITVSNAVQAKLEEAVTMVLTKVAGDPNHMAYPNMSYSGGGPPGDSPNNEPVNFPPFGRGGPFGGGGPPLGQGPPMGPPLNQGPPSLFSGGVGGYPHGGPGGGMPGDFMSGGGGMPPQGGPNPHMGGGPPQMSGPPIQQSPINMQGKMFGPQESFGGPKPNLGVAATSMGSGAMNQLQNSAGGGAGGGGGLKFNPLEGLGNTEVLQFLDSLQSTLRSSGFNEQAVADIMQAMQVLAKYNIMGLGLGLGVAAMATMRTDSTSQQAPTSQAPAGPPSMDPGNPRIQQITQDNRPFGGGGPDQRSQEAVFMTSQAADPFFVPDRARPSIPAGNGALSGTGGSNDLSAFFGSVASGQNDPGPGGRGPVDHPSDGGRRLDGGSERSSSMIGQSRWDSSDSRDPRSSLGGGGAGGPPQGGPGDRGQSYHGTERSFAQSVMKLKPAGDPRRLEFDLPEQIVGAVMGPKATTLAEIQRYSGATVEIARKADGTNPGYRTITIRAPDPESVRAGRFMVERAINEEQKRRQQNQTQQGSGPMY